ncbi:hypothetical protein [Vibrio genomosp. F6]|uniref:hypothetical protein n=1 Tax=Vibrio genomosp. F6 TaxID=723172 RepID=UPI001F10CC9A|nr:hypothetical protein [Vibrio genomosp. F6]
MSKLIIKIMPYTLLLGISCLKADTLEDVTCYLSDAVPECVASTKDTGRINVVLRPEYTVVKVEPVTQTINPILNTQTSSEWTMKDVVSAILATIGTAGFLLNFYNLRLSNQNRKKDQYSERFHFWLKEIIYPQHIQPLITKLTDIARDYNSWVSLEESDDKSLRKERFMEAWPEEKLSLLNALPNEDSLPYLNEVFSSAKANILQLDELLLSTFLIDEIVEFPCDDEGSMDMDREIEGFSDADAYRGRELLDKTIQDIYSSIYEAQKKPL